MVSLTFQSQLSLRQTPFGSAVIGHLESCPSYRELNKMTVELSTVETNLAGFWEGGELQKGMAIVRYCRHERAMIVHVQVLLSWRGFVSFLLPQHLC